MLEIAVMKLIMPTVFSDDKEAVSEHNLDHFVLFVIILDVSMSVNKPLLLKSSY